MLLKELLNKKQIEEYNKKLEYLLDPNGPEYSSYEENFEDDKEYLIKNFLTEIDNYIYDLGYVLSNSRENNLFGDYYKNRNEMFEQIENYLEIELKAPKPITI